MNDVGARAAWLFIKPLVGGTLAVLLACSFLLGVVMLWALDAVEKGHEAR